MEMMEVPTSWDSLRKQARKLEAQLDERMSSYRKLVSTSTSIKADSAESDLESWIEQLLKQLQQINSQMQAWVSSSGSEMVSHTLNRHQEILQDLAQIQHAIDLDPGASRGCKRDSVVIVRISR
ncbi:hypothetical protein RIF29_19574 [Crotalaria pallida]|uniref:Golgi SNAP receptor complex member 1 n=1 Tax=Crotalaria pallida TaxID=3830 RepID=A0AAN9F819_CROPI